MKPKPRIPTRSEYLEIMRDAHKAGVLAAQRCLEDCHAKWGIKESYDGCGGGFLVLQIDERSALGKFLKEHKEISPHGSLSRHLAFLSGVFVEFSCLTTRQDQNINLAGERAALKTLKERLGVEGYVRPFVD